MALWNFTIDDTSPYLSYSPYGDGIGLVNGWQTWYTQSQYNTAPDQVSRGESFHVTSRPNTNVTLQFYGTGVSLYGSTNSSFDVILDNTSTSMNTATTPLLYSIYNLTNALHSITLSAQPSSISSSSPSFTFNFAVTSSPLDTDENPPSPLFYDNSNTASLQYSGTWAADTQSGVPNATVSSSFHTTAEDNASVSLSFTGGNAVAVKGLVGSANGLYSVSIDGSTRTFNGSSSWIIPDALLYFRAGLDPTATHQINITNLSGNSNSRLCLNSITVFKHEPKNPVPPPGGSASKDLIPSRSPVNLGVILGPILGCLALGFIGLFIWYRRRRLQKAKPAVFQSSPLAKSFIQTPPAVSHPARPRFTPQTRFVSGSDNRSISGSDTRSDVVLLNPQVPDQRSLAIISEAGSPRRKPTNPPANRERYYSRSTTVTSSSGYDHDHSFSTSEIDGSIQLPISLLTSFWVPHSQYAGSSRSDAGSSRTSHVPPEYIPLSPRKPLPIIPVPSYDAALQAPELTPADVKDMSSLQYGGDSGLDPPYTAPPRYER